MNFFIPDCEYQVIALEGGKCLILYKEHTFWQSGMGPFWYCSSYFRGCKCKFKRSVKNKIIDFTNEHNHEPPPIIKSNYKKTQNEKIIQLD